jgi:hypothetical protein
MEGTQVQEVRHRARSILGKKDSGKSQLNCGMISGNLQAKMVGGNGEGDSFYNDR